MVRMRHQATDKERENLGQTPGTDIIANNPGGKFKGTVYQDQILEYQAQSVLQTSKNVIASTGSVTGDNSSGNVTKTASFLQAPNDSVEGRTSTSLRANKNFPFGANKKKNLLLKKQSSDLAKSNKNRLNIY